MLARIALALLSLSLVQSPAPRGSSQGNSSGRPLPIPDGALTPRGNASLAEKLGENLYRVGKIRVDTAKREAVMPGTINDVSILEFVANTKGGFKAYESAITIDTDALTFNLAMILMGLDRTHAVPSTKHFDPDPPKGDPVEIWIEWMSPKGPRKIRAEELVYDKKTTKTLPIGPWVYTGSVFDEVGHYLAESDGVLIGFVHTPAPVIENPSLSGLGLYGSFSINPEFALSKDQAVTVTVRAIK